MLERTRRPVTPAPESPFTPASAFGAYALAFLGLIVASFVVPPSTDGDETSVPLLFTAALVGWLVYGVVLWGLSAREGTGDPAVDYAARVSWGDLVGIPIGVALQLVVAPLLYWPLRSIWPDAFSDDEVNEFAQDLVDNASGVGIVLLVLMVVVGAPLVEELVYRGLLQRSLARVVRPELAVLLAAAIFTLIHFRPVEYPGLLLVGIVFGACVAVTGRVGTAIVAHAAFNATALIVVAA